MKYAAILSLFLVVFPSWLSNLGRDKLIMFASLSYYGCDFDGDKLTDLSTWDSKTNTLYFRLSSNQEFYKRRFFDSEAMFEPVFADYDGDGKTDFAFFHPDSGQWLIINSSNPDNPRKTFFGNIGDLPIPTDIKGKGVFRPTVWRPNIDLWLISDVDETGNDVEKVIQEGSYQDSVFSGDYDGDGKSDLTVWRPNEGIWHIVKSSTGFDFSKSEHIQHGKEWDVIVPNDYNADGTCDLVFWRPENQTWYFLYSGSGRNDQIKFGSKGDVPLSADIDGDKIPELITWSREKKSWTVLNFVKQETLSYKWSVSDNCLPAVSILQKYE